jgi:hypothetical protein
VIDKWLSVVNNATLEQSSSHCGPRRVGSKNSAASGEWQWGDRKAGGGSVVAVEQAAVMRAQRLGSRMDGETTAIREEGASGDFLFLFPCRWQCCLLGRSSVEVESP